jgi:hypothetical protein
VPTHNHDTDYVNVTGDTMTSTLAVQHTSTPVITAERYSVGGGDGVGIYLRKSRNTTLGAHTILADGDPIGTIQGWGSDGSAFREAVRISFEVDGTPGASDMPGRIVFRTTPDGTVTPVERLRIDQSGLSTFSGNVKIAKTNALLEVVDTSGANPQISAYDTTDGGGTLFTSNGDVLLAQVGTGGSWIRNIFAAQKLDGAMVIYRDLYLCDDTDNTKQAFFDFSAIAAATQRAFAWPNVSGTVAMVPTLTSRTNTGASIAAGAIQTVTCSCNAGEVAISGGWSGSNTQTRVYLSGPQSSTTWEVRWKNESAGSAFIIAYALCAKFGA